MPESNEEIQAHELVCKAREMRRRVKGSVPAAPCTELTRCMQLTLPSPVA